MRATVRLERRLGNLGAEAEACFCRLHASKGADGSMERQAATAGLVRTAVRAGMLR